MNFGVLHFRPSALVANLYALAHAILDARSIAPHRPKMPVMMREVVVLVHPACLFVELGRISTLRPHIADHDMLTGHSRQCGEVDLMRVFRHPRSGKHDRRLSSKDGASKDGKQQGERFHGKASNHIRNFSFHLADSSSRPKAKP